ncbi:MAG: transporter substrate-binding domain-containing protein [Gammaproteobacteria bacterium]|nr:transporter substrate-binding domain-containing protein [Gammaproteobacteria bacterium]
MISRFKALFTTIILLSSAFGVEARSYDDVVNSGYIEIAVYNNFPPYSFNDAGEARGIDIEIGKMIATELGVEPRWFWFNADETLDDDLRNAIWKGHYLNRRIADLMMRVPYDPEFSRLIDGYGAVKNDMVVMFGPYHRERWWIARDLAKTGEIRSLANFQYLDIGVEIDTFPDFFLSSVFAGRLRDRVEHYISIFGATDDLIKGNIAALVGTRSQVEWGLRESASADLSDEGLEFMNRRVWDIGLAVRHNFRQLAYSIEDIVLNLFKRGDIQGIFKQHRLTYEVPAAYQ